ncbi:hypothetical protein [Streptacidiphilus anmyonensis]|uniref:hypothetical protein n=1 Tax=Streptacidiphilus anmyonensis TaxID=405782 RepID=UPI000693FDFF|nr:hypothetical protein [Streptacidiphilus anmyonensis]
MDIASPLMAEDKPDYVRILDEALQAPHIRDAVRATRGAITTQQLHDRAMRELSEVSAQAAPEYAHLLALREQVAQVGTGPDTDRLGSTDPAQWVEPGTPLDAGRRAGLGPMAAVLAPVLAWTSALALWLIGLAVRAGSPSLALGHQLFTAAGALAAVGAAALGVATVALVLTAKRDAAVEPDLPQPELAAEVAKAREVWRAALRSRGVLPFLEAELANRAAAIATEAAQRHTRVDLVRHSPKLGFTSPGFTSPGVEGITDGHGQEKPEVEREEEVYFTSPGFSSPDFTSPGPAGRFLPNADD